MLGHSGSMRGIDRSIAATAMAVLIAISPGAVQAAMALPDRVVVGVAEANLVDDQGVANGRVQYGKVFTVLEARGPWLLVAADARSWIRRDQVIKAADAVIPLSKVVGDAANQAEARIKAADILGEIGEDANPAVQELLNVLETDDNDDVAKAVVGALSRVGRPDIPWWIRTLNERSHALNLRAVAVVVLGRISREPAMTMQPLLKVLTDETEVSFLRDAAAIEIVSFGDAVVPALATILESEKQSLDNRIAAARLLNELPSGPEAVVRVCAKEATDWRLRRLALELASGRAHAEQRVVLARIAGGIIGDRRQVTALRETAIMVFGRCGPFNGEVADPETLLQVLRNPDDGTALRETAFDSLKQLGATGKLTVLDLIKYSSFEDDLERHSDITRPVRGLSEMVGSAMVRAGAVAFRPISSISRRKPAASWARVGSSQLPGRVAGDSPVFKELAAPGRELKAVPRDALGLRVHEFAEPPRIADRGFTVDSAGHIVADAIARQLGVLGFDVALETTVGSGRRVNEQGDLKAEASLAVAHVSGKVNFDIDHIPGKEMDQTTACLDVKVRIAGSKAAQASLLFERSYREVATIEAPGRAGRSSRSQSAAAAVLSRFVDKFVSDPELEQKLTAFAGSKGR